MTNAKRPRRIAGQTIPCGWCGNPIAVRTTGRISKWCSPVCRHRAWEQRQAAASGRAAVEVVDRVIEVEKEIRVVEQVDVAVVPTGAGWPTTLAQLVTQIDAGRVYDRDLGALAHSLDAVLKALSRRKRWQHPYLEPDG